MTDASTASISGNRRRAGLSIPLFSFPSTSSWGIGDIGDIEPMTAWLAGGRQRVLQLLPINERAPGQTSPYSAISAMAIDPVFIELPAVADFDALGGEASLSPEDRERLDAVRRSPRIEHAEVRALKGTALRAAFDRFFEKEWCRDGARARTMRMFLSEQAWWIEDYSLFRALHAREDERAWTEWPVELQRREPGAIDRARRELSRDVLFFQYVQWIAAMQWREARQRTHGVELFGDLPFMVDGDSADVWARQHQFILDASLGVPPDAFSATGQDWGMPVYRWDVVAMEDYRWLHERARRSADLFDGYRIDHLVGFYRTYGRPKNGGEPFFTPSDEWAQQQLGERLLDIFRAAGAEIVAEDLGTVPDFVRASLARLGVPGYRVFRWERYWHSEGQPFRDPTDYPKTSVATSGTHDTEPMSVWWGRAPEDERHKVAALPTIQRLSGDGDFAHTRYDARVRDTLIEALFTSGSELLLLPLGDVFGWDDRINEPATVGEHNWSFRLPWPVDKLDDVPEALERQLRLRAWAKESSR
jgi:4-alpha-glucanotransferase